jgi:hypothetical protein
MKKTALLLPTIFLANCLLAQISVTGAYKTFDAAEWQDAIETQTDITLSATKGWNVGIDYWFRLKNRRVEFTPELSYESHSFSFETGEIEHRLMSFHFNTNLYFLDFDNDCNCPTFSKQGNFFTKGFFVQLSPGVSRIQNKLQWTSPDQAIEDDVFAFTVGGGVGLDFGISQLLTVTPLVKYYWYPSATWEGLEVKGEEGISQEASITQFYAGIKLGFRLKPEQPYWK